MNQNHFLDTKLFDLTWQYGNLSEVLLRQEPIDFCKKMERFYGTVEKYKGGKFQIKYNSTQK